MSRLMIFRLLFCEEGSSAPDIVAGKAAVDALISRAHYSELARICDMYSAGMYLPSPGVDEVVTRRALRDVLYEQLDELKKHINDSWGREVGSYGFADPVTGRRVYFYITGGVTGGDDPTDAYTAMEVVVDNDIYLPSDWQCAIRDACGFIDPERVHMVIADR